MLKHIDITKVLFLDIETVPVCSTYEELPESFRALWNEKAKNLSLRENAIRKKEDIDTQDVAQTGKEMYSRAGIYAEFGKIICITVGYIKGRVGDRQFRMKSFYGDDEKKLLADFVQLLDTYYYSALYLLCAHNGKEFDFPYIARRIIINGLQLPKLLDIAGKKPWEVKHLDTMELWKFGDYKHYTSLNLLATLFHIPTPKDDINGSDVAKVYWQDKDLDRIVIYCQKDVLTIAQLLLRFKGEPLIDEKMILIV